MRTITLYSYLLICLFLVNVQDLKAYDANADKVSYQGAPFAFLENKGQVTDQHRKSRGDIDFSLKTPGLNVFIGNGLIQYQWNRRIKTEPKDSIQATEMYAMYVTLVGANKDAEIVREQSAGYHENYYLPHCPNGAVAYSYTKITYKNIYPHIDWVLYTKTDELSHIGDHTSQMKYDFIVHAGGNPDDIKLKYTGDTALVLNEGAVRAYTPLGSITEEAPYAYELESKKQVQSNFVQEGDLLTFAVSDYTGDLVIDPSVRWATYFGGTYNEEGTSIASQHGYGTFYRMYLAGNAMSFDIAMSFNPHQQQKSEVYTNSDRYDGFIAAFSSSGRREWSTYFGGNDHDYIRAAVCDKAGNLILSGSTKSDTGISTTNSLKPDPVYLASLPTDGFIAKFDSSGKRLWGRYTGGESWDDVKAMCTDAFDNIYITGETYSSSGIGTIGTYQAYPLGGRDAFIEKYTSNGVKVWGSYYGDNMNDVGTAVVCDNAGNIYLGGNTIDDTCENSSGIPDTAIASTNAHQLLPGNIALGCPVPVLPLPPPFSDGFLVKFNAGNGTRLWGTYYGGGAGDDFINAVTFDSTKFVDKEGKPVDGLVYIGGVTQSNEGIASAGGWDTTTIAAHRQSADGFIAAFKPNGQRYWGTYLGGDGSEIVTALCMDAKGAVHAVGQTSSTGMSIPVFLGNPPYGSHGFHAVFNQAAMQSFMYIAGNKSDRCNAIVCNDVDQAYIAGSTMSDSGIVESGIFGTPFQPTKSGAADNDAFLASYDNDLPIEFRFEVPPMSPFGNFCPGLDYIGTFYLVTHNAQGIVFQPGNYFTVQLSDSSGSFANPLVIGGGTNAGAVSCVIPKGTAAGNNYRFRFISSRPLMVSKGFGCVINKEPNPIGTVNSPLCEGDTLKLTGTDATTGTIIDNYHWFATNFSVWVKDTFIANVTTAHTGTYFFTSRSNYSCTHTDTVNVVVKPRPDILNIGNNSPVCEGQPVHLLVFADTANGGTFTWTGPGFTSIDQNPSLENPSVNNTGVYYAKFTKYGCTATDSTMVVIDTLPEKPLAGSNSPLCYGDTLKLTVDNIQQGVQYLWNGPASFSSTLPGHYILNSTDGMSGEYIIRATKDKCSNADSIMVMVKPQLPPPDVTSNSPVKAGDELLLYANGPTGANYNWAGPDSFYSNEQNPVIKFVPFTGTGQYRVAMNVDGCTSSGGIFVVVNTTSEVFFVLFPNPNNGNFTIKATLNNDQVVPLEVVTATGQKVYEDKLVSNRRLLVAPVSLPGSLSSGDYYLRIRTDGGDRVIPFSIVR